MEVNLLQKIQAAADYIRSRSSISPQIGLILGSGLGDIADEITDAVRIDYHDIPHFPVSTVEGHAGRLSAKAGPGASPRGCACQRRSNS